jgi:hypothetical protein
VKGYRRHEYDRGVQIEKRRDDRDREHRHDEESYVITRGTRDETAHGLKETLTRGDVSDEQKSSDQNERLPRM